MATIYVWCCRELQSAEEGDHCKCVWSIFPCHSGGICWSKYVWRSKESECLDSTGNVIWDGVDILYLYCCHLRDGYHCNKKYPIHGHYCYARRKGCRSRCLR